VALEPHDGIGIDAPWVIEDGCRVPGMDGRERLTALRAGLSKHPAVVWQEADASDERVEAVLRRLHEADYLDTLLGIRADTPVLMPELAQPGSVPDIPVSAALVSGARESVRSAVSAADRILAGAPFAYSLARPPGHHAGPSWIGGYCYLNGAAAAAEVLRTAGLSPVGILDIDIHYPNGTSAIVADLDDVHLHSLHSWPVKNGPARSAPARSARERMVEFRTAPTREAYLAQLSISLELLAATAAVLVISIGYDTIAGDPHGAWALPRETFADIGTLLAGTGVPICAVQEGGYALGELSACSHQFALGLLGDAHR
jgi:acetoin utilization deacetylase AcuC-like enzyme